MKIRNQNDALLFFDEGRLIFVGDSTEAPQICKHLREKTAVIDFEVLRANAKQVMRLAAVEDCRLILIPR